MDSISKYVMHVHLCHVGKRLYSGLRWLSNIYLFLVLESLEMELKETSKRDVQAVQRTLEEEMQYSMKLDLNFLTFYY